MTRRNISLPDDLDDLARRAGLNVSALARAAIIAELDRADRMARLDAWLDELDELHGPPSARAIASATAWVDTVVPVEHHPVALPRPRKKRTTRDADQPGTAPRRRSAAR